MNVKTHPKPGGDGKPIRKNSNPMINYNFSNNGVATSGNSSAVNKPSKLAYSTPTSNSYSTTPTGAYNKSSSYPNFNAPHGNQYHSYHRHSVSNLITITPTQPTASLLTQSAPISHQPQKSTNCVNLITSANQKATALQSSILTTAKNHQNNNNNTSTVNNNKSASSARTAGGKQAPNKNAIGDINSRLEFLCLQMTEQAIN